MLPRKAQVFRSRRSRYARKQSSAISTTTTPASSRWENSMKVFSSPTSGTTSPPQSGHPLVPLPPGPQPSPESLTRTTPPTMISRNVTSAVRSARRRNRRSPAPPPPAPGPAMPSGYRLARFGRGAAGPVAAAHRLTDVAQRLVAPHVRDDVEVVGRGRRRREPLERLAAPGIVAGPDAAARREIGVDERQYDADGEDEGADRRDQVVGVQAHRVDRIARLEELEDVHLLSLHAG